MTNADVCKVCPGRSRFIASGLISVAPSNEQLGHFMWRGCHPGYGYERETLPAGVTDHTPLAALRPHFTPFPKTFLRPLEGFDLVLAFINGHLKDALGRQLLKLQVVLVSLSKISR